MIDNGMASTNLFFDAELLGILDAEEVVYIQLYINYYFYDNQYFFDDLDDFSNSSSFFKLFDYYISEMPYGVAKARTGDPCVWILNRLMEKQSS